MVISRIQEISAVANILKVVMTGFLAFVIAFAITPILTYFLYKYKIGIKIKNNSVDGEKLTYVNKLHKDKSDILPGRSQCCRRIKFIEPIQRRCFSQRYGVAFGGRSNAPTV